MTELGGGKIRSESERETVPLVLCVGRVTVRKVGQLSSSQVVHSNGLGEART